MAKYVSEERLNEIVKMINKLLCFIRRKHEFEMQLSTEILSRRINSIDGVVRYKKVCKHCGKIKNDS